MKWRFWRRKRITCEWAVGVDSYGGNTIIVYVCKTHWYTCESYTDVQSHMIEKMS